MARYRWQVLRAGSFKLDGGSMFGVVPRSVWSRTVTADDRGRIAVQHNCVLLRRVDVGPGPMVILLEAGTGDKLDPKSRDLFELENRNIEDAVRDAGVDPAAVDAVVVSHLHFDHSGGLTRAVRPGETPDWTGPASTFTGARPDHGVRLTFPNAPVHVQQREWRDALANRSVMSRTYFKDHLEPIRERVKLVDSPRAFPAGTTPGRDDQPLAPVEQRMTEVALGVRVFLVPGHTWGQQATAFEDERGRTVVFTPDVLPTAWHVGAAYSLAYDVEPYTSMISRRLLLEDACERGWLLVLGHEPGHPVFTARRKGDWFELVPTMNAV